MHISCIIFAPLWGLFLSSHILRICQWVLWFKHKFSRCDGRRRTCSSERNIRLLPVDWRKDKFKIEAANSEDWRKDKFKIGGRKIL